MAISISDVANGKRRIDDLGDPRNFRHLKQYCKFYAQKNVSIVMASVLMVPLVTSVLDFFFPYKNYKNNNNNREKNGRRGKTN